MAGFKYNDSIGILLCNFYDGHLHINESAYIDLMYLIEHDKLREFANDLIKECNTVSISVQWPGESA